MRRILHLVRGSEPVPVVAHEDWVVYLGAELRLADHGRPPVPPGPIDHDRLVALVEAAELVITW